MKAKGQKILSKFLTILLVLLAFIVLVLLFKTVTGSDISIFGHKFYYIASESMYPTIKADSLIVVRNVDTDKLEVGDIISFTSRDPAIYGMVNTHRIYDITTDEDGRQTFVTMGDNNPKPDDYLVYPEEIKGKVVLHTIPIRPLAQLLSFAATRTGFMVCVMMPLLLVAGLFFNSFIREMRAYVNDEEKSLTQIRQQKAIVQTQMLDMQNVTPAQAKAILEQIFQKELHEITPDDIDHLLDTMKGGDK